MRARLFIRAAVFLAAASPAFSDELTALPAPPPRAYPYKILDIQPGQIATEVLPQVEAHLGGSMAPERMQQVVTSPAGRRFEAELTVGYKTAAVDLYTTMGDEPYESVSLTTATPVLEGRIVAIARNLRKPTAELPEPAEVFAQVEALYGEPTWRGDRFDTPHILYVWTPDGQMPPQQEQPCGHAFYDGYEFRPEREPENHPECSALLKVAFDTKAGNSTLYFSLIDLDLARLDTAETERQIRDALETELVPSDMKL